MDHCGWVVGEIHYILMNGFFKTLIFLLTVNEGQGTTARPEYRGMVHAVRTIVKNTGFLGLYQGVTPNVWGAGLSWGFYFLL